MSNHFVAVEDVPDFEELDYVIAATDDAEFLRFLVDVSKQNSYILTDMSPKERVRRNNLPLNWFTAFQIS